MTTRHTSNAFVDRQLALFRGCLDPISGCYFDSLMRRTLAPRKKSGPSERRARHRSVRDRMAVDLKRSRYGSMTARNFALIFERKINDYKTRFDPALPMPADEEKAFLHFVCQHFGGKWSAKSISNLLAQKVSQSFDTP
ncbi:hypothetical protein [Rhizobium leguminosarum]|uniref:Uncharacterized protein n=1 Tax=Rhizobium leguminosarum bv. viciae TaxID=387 RepID=A0A8G2J7G0_RHILV|nr:hypothetical protein [Rhizobium leguminosarum]NKK18620.1 hypothetical protein [Rhizobium leguminosarum bv. viciae]TBX98093.1 hypothetical protein E0H31_04080 [Rhizobium leguminosarum bv. viciae]TBZ10929.1 hypothetical protein E0H52_32525 [Rhizobium leguminosarum bv. viciae]